MFNTQLKLLCSVGWPEMSKNKPDSLEIKETTREKIDPLLD